MPKLTLPSRDEIEGWLVANAIPLGVGLVLASGLFPRLALLSVGAMFFVGAAVGAKVKERESRITIKELARGVLVLKNVNRRLIERARGRARR